MTIKQRFLKAIYPAIIFFSKQQPSNKLMYFNTQFIVPNVSFFNLSSELSNGKPFEFAALKGKKVMIVNTASDCGFTAQYTELERLYTLHRNKLIILAFPANDFREQEKDTDENIAKFCTINYGVSFPIMKKCSTRNTPAQHAVYKWLCNAIENGWNNQPPVWNFSKYLINENGVLTHFFKPAVSPLSTLILDAIEQ